MASEPIYVPEEHLLEVILVIRAGLAKSKVSRETRTQLLKWCKEEEAYIKRLSEE